MTHASGITVAKELEEAFASARESGDVRFLQIVINDESLEVEHTENAGTSEQDDFSKLEDRITERKCNFFLYRLDTKGELGYNWAFLSYVPDGSPVRDRMLFASSRDTCKKMLGYSYFTLDINGSQKEEFTWDAFSEAKDSKKNVITDDVLTTGEQLKLQHATAVVVGGGGNGGAVKFPLSDEGQNALTALAQGDCNLAQFSLDLTAETIELANTDTIDDVAGVQAHINTEEPRFSLYSWAHEHEGEQLSSIVFIYSCPDNAPIRSRMLYSTTKSVMVGYAEQLGLTPASKLEVSEPEELTEELVRTSVHPPVAKAVTRRAKPKRAGKGGRRLVRRPK